MLRNEEQQQEAVMYASLSVEVIGPVGKNVVIAPGSLLSQGATSCPVKSKSLRTQGPERCILGASIDCRQAVGNISSKRQCTAKALRYRPD
jgi:hypothetical protein